MPTYWNVNRPMLPPKRVGRYFTSLSPPTADGVADTFGGRTSALPLILRRCKYRNLFWNVIHPEGVFLGFLVFSALAYLRCAWTASLFNLFNKDRQSFLYYALELAIHELYYLAGRTDLSRHRKRWEGLTLPPSPHEATIVYDRLLAKHLCTTPTREGSDYDAENFYCKLLPVEFHNERSY